MPFEKGKSGNKRGRPKGAGGKVTQAVKDAVQTAFDEVGGADYLVQVAREDHKTFCALLGRVIPTQVNATIATAKLTKEQRDAAVAAYLKSIS